MKPLIFVLAICLILTLVINLLTKPKIIPKYVRRTIKREMTRSIGQSANGAYLLEFMDFEGTQQFVYKYFISDTGMLTLQVDYAFNKQAATKGPIALLTGDVLSSTTGTSTSAPFSGGSGYPQKVSGETSSTYENMSAYYQGTGTGALFTVKVDNGVVTKVNMTAQGSNYQKDDILFPCFKTINAQGEVTIDPTTNKICKGFLNPAGFKVAAVKKQTVQNQSIFNPTWDPYTTVSEIGPNAVYASNFLEKDSNGNGVTYLDVYNGNGNGYYDGVCSSSRFTVDVPAKKQWFCLMDELAVVRNKSTRNNLRFNTMVILAKTSELKNLRVYYLILTYTGFGILSAPRGAQITVDLFVSGYADLFTEIGHPRCGQTGGDLSGDSLYSAFPSIGKSYFSNYPCGNGCAVVVPPADENSYKKLIWEMASPNGLYRLQFFDSGHSRFLKVKNSGVLKALALNSPGTGYTRTQILPLSILTPGPGSTGLGTGAKALISVTDKVVTAVTLYTEGNDQYSIGDILYPTGNDPLTACTLSVVQIDNALDPYYFRTSQEVGETNVTTYPQCTIDEVNVTLVPLKKLDIKIGYWILRGATYYSNRDGTLVSIGNSDLMVQITDAGNLVLMKNYMYSGNVHHVSVQSAIGMYVNADLSKKAIGLLDPLVSNVGGQANNETKKKHWKLGNTLTCYGVAGAASFDFANGTILAQTETITTGLNNTGKYMLWLSPFGLRLLFGMSPTVAILGDFHNCIWITPVYDRWWYIDGDKGNRLVTTITFCKNSLFQPQFPIPTIVENGGPAATKGNPNIDTCGTFNKPVILVGKEEKEILVLRSRNKRYIFHMLTSGRCEMLDLSDNTVLFSTDNFNVVSTRSLCYT